MSTLFNVLGSIYFLAGLIVGLVKIRAAIRALRRSPLRAVRDGALRITWFIIGFLVLAALGSKSAHGRGQTINMIWIFATIAALIYAVSAVVRIRREHRTQDRQTEQRMRERPVPEGIVYANAPRPLTESADAPAPVQALTRPSAGVEAARDMRR